jgi:hypothetical protein
MRLKRDVSDAGTLCFPGLTASNWIEQKIMRVARIGNGE